MEYIWSCEDLLEATGGVLTGSPSWQANRIIIDSRIIKPKDVFVAFNGEQQDGHNYISHAFSFGAAVAIAERRPEDLAPNHPVIIVKNCQDALTKMGEFNRARSKAKFIAVTGSAGKTSTKEALRVAFSAYGKTYATAGNFNNQLGVPISLASMPLDTEYAIFELGMNHAGELADLSKQVRPFVSIITTVAAAHLEFFASISKIAEAKAEIFVGTDKDGYAIINHDIAEYNLLFEHAKDKYHVANIVNFGQSENSDCKLISYLEDQTGCNVKANIMGEEISYRLASHGIHLAANSLTVLAALKSCNLDIKAGAKNLESFSSLKGRGQRHRIKINQKNCLIIDESYNANPSSMKAAIKVLSEVTGKGRKIAIISDMRELGKDSIKLHQELSHDILTLGIDRVITMGSNMLELYKILPADKKIAHFDNIEQLLASHDQLLEDGDQILIKGSNGTQIYKLTEYLVK